MVATLAAVALMSACQGTVESVTGPSVVVGTSTTVGEAEGQPEWLSLEVRYSPRHSVGRRRLDVLTTNDGPAEILVTSIALRSDHFRPLAPEEKSSRIPPGATVAVKADFGLLESCESSQELAAMVLIDISIDEAAPISLRAPLDPEPLDRIRDLECSELAVRRAVGVGFGDEWTTEGSTVSTDLVFTHLEGEDPVVVVVVSVGGMILFGMQPYPDREPPLAVLEPRTDPLRVPVDLTLIRCDVHAVSQAPDGYAFRVWMAVGNREPFAITVVASGSLQSQLEELVDQCIGV